MATATAVVVAGDDWSTRSRDDGVEVGSRHGITGDDVVESQMSFPISRKFCREFLFFFFLFSSNGGKRK